MKRPDCTQCQEWELCPFHGDDAPPSTERAVEAISTPDVAPTWADIAVTIDDCVSIGVVAPDPSWRLLGPDDSEVGDDLIYADDSIGGVWAVPRRA